MKPVAIFQHGITRNRSDALAMADGFADQCFVVAAMDAPLHGIVNTGATDPLTAGELAVALALSSVVFFAVMLSYDLELSLVALLVCLIPTTIGGLLSAIGVLGAGALQ